MFQSPGEKTRILRVRNPSLFQPESNVIRIDRLPKTPPSKKHSINFRFPYLEMAVFVPKFASTQRTFKMCPILTGYRGRCVSTKTRKRPIEIARSLRMFVCSDKTFRSPPNSLWQLWWIQFQIFTHANGKGWIFYSYLKNDFISRYIKLVFVLYVLLTRARVCIQLPRFNKTWNEDCII